MKHYDAVKFVAHELSGQNVKLVHIDYWVEKAETGIHFDNNVLHIDNQKASSMLWMKALSDTGCLSLPLYITLHYATLVSPLFVFNKIIEVATPTKPPQLSSPPISSSPLNDTTIDSINGSLASGNDLLCILMYAEGY
ncbi:hypothetical protein ACOSQ2_016344 [Xanthoceras sorbifolium]